MWTIAIIKISSAMLLAFDTSVMAEASEVQNTGPFADITFGKRMGN